MIHFIIHEGLGNQMFQYAFALALRARGRKVVLDISYYDFFYKLSNYQMHNGFELDWVFGIKDKPVNRAGLHIHWLRLLHRLRPPFLYRYDDGHFDSRLLAHPPMYLRGFWEDERYFKDAEDDVRRVFCFQGIDEKNLALAEEIRSRNSVSIHVRRGDFAAANRVLLGEDYYRKAVEFIKNKVEEPFFYVFTDDAEVGRTIADGIGIQYKLLQHNKGADSYKDMYLMSQCRHNIIANSSFSWWGAWLNDNENKIVVSPGKYVKGDDGDHPQPTKWFII